MAGADQDGKPGVARVVLPEALTIAESGDCYRELRQCMEQGGDIEVDTDALNRIDAAGIQMLFAIQRTLHETGHALRWSRAGRTFADAAELLGMSASLGITADA
jgi:anti-anti-sigma regulatory factor